MDGDEVYLVVGSGVILAAYRRRETADIHSRCLTGATVTALRVDDQVPPEILEDLEIEDDWEGGDTPVVDVVGSVDGRGSDSIPARTRGEGPKGTDR